MDISSEEVRVKEKPNYVWQSAGDRYVCDLVNSRKAENCEILPFRKLSTKNANEALALQERLREQIIVKIENGNQTNDTNENVSGYQKNLEEHKKNTVHDSNKCDIGLESFGQKVHLNRYVDAVHHHSKSYQCDICHECYSLKGTLNVHVQLVHEGYKPFECEICHKSFRRKGDLKTHINGVHIWSKSFYCNICHKSFKFKQSFKSHLKAVHDGNKPFESDISHKSFGYQSLFKTPIIKEHDRRKPFECVICHESFRYHNILKIHMRVIHRRITYQM
ncbi:zinc finger protein 658-like [Trichogramma pretiosum]|uniref:zinc finger protein 658-like n=1 Tax=Trichogramma pretiosum TaxID=7493 RepID=UPI0006C97C85|nr:zinc finger protein 658-like [Trichogramma pretiosum]